MTTMNCYLNFDGKAEEAFTFYKTIFGGEYLSFNRIGEAPGMDALSAEDRNRIMHISLPINEGYILMGSDIVPAFGQSLTMGNNIKISLHPSTRQEADRLFNGLSASGQVEMPMADQFWGSYYGSFIDKFGVGWMINCDLK